MDHHAAWQVVIVAGKLALERQRRLLLAGAAAAAHTHNADTADGDVEAPIQIVGADASPAAAFPAAFLNGGVLGCWSDWLFLFG